LNMAQLWLRHIRFWSEASQMLRNEICGFPSLIRKGPQALCG
jgi:hypothetical protein